MTRRPANYWDTIVWGNDPHTTKLFGEGNIGNAMFSSMHLPNRFHGHMLVHQVYARSSLSLPPSLINRTIVQLRAIKPGKILMLSPLADLLVGRLFDVPIGISAGDAFEVVLDVYAPAHEQAAALWTNPGAGMTEAWPNTWIHLAGVETEAP